MKSIDSLRADALLASTPRNKESPFYVEATFQYKLRRAHQRRHRLSVAPPDPASAHLVRSEWAAALNAADLTPYERLVLAARLRGHSQEEIAARFDVTRQAISKVLRRAAAKVRLAHQSNPLAGLRDVYLAEIRRGNRTQIGRYPSD